MAYCPPGDKDMKGGKGGKSMREDSKADKAADKKAGIKEGSKADKGGKAPEMTGKQMIAKAFGGKGK